MVETDDADFRSGMRRVASSVAVITSRSGSEPLGITATSVASVSLEPPAILACVNRSARLHQAIVDAGAFRVNYLASSQRSVARIFGTAGSEARFSHGEWDLDAEHGPRLRGALAQMTCRLDRSIDYGTHTIFVGAVQSVRVRPETPLLYCNGRFSSLAA